MTNEPMNGAAPIPETNSDASSIDEGNYRVELDVFSGPMDLLLYLIRKEEIDIYDIPIARILDQFMGHLKVLEELELDEIGDFLVMAANLMLIKARMLVPEPVDFDLDDEEIEDPRAELVQKLLEYKRYKEAAHTLAEQAELRAKRVGRGKDRDVPPPEPADGPVRVKVELWDLVEAFAKLVRELGAGKRLPTVIGRGERPVSSYMEEVVGRLHREPTFFLDELVDEAATRTDAVSYFMALLELIRQRAVAVRQQGAFGRIRVEKRAEAEAIDYATVEAAFSSELAGDDALSGTPAEAPLFDEASPGDVHAEGAEPPQGTEPDARPSP